MKERRKRILAKLLVFLMIQTVIDYSAFTQVNAGVLNEETLSEGSIPEDTISEDTISNDTISEDSVSEDTISDNTISGDFISGNHIEEASKGASGDWSKLQAKLDAVKTDEVIDLSDYTTPEDSKVYTFTIGSNKKFTLKGNGTHISNVSFVFATNNTITIDNISIESADNHADTADSSKIAYAPLYFSGTGNTLVLKGSNTIQSGQKEAVDKYGAAIGVPSGASLTIKASVDSADASLNADSTKDGTSSGSGAGIGGGCGISAGTVTIESGNLTVIGSSAGIGGGSLGDGGIVAIKGGKLNIQGMGGAGIGGSSNMGSNGGKGGNVTITGGVITAKGSGGAGIGGGSCMSGTAGSGGTVTIKGGTVRAIGEVKCAGIGGAGSFNGTAGGGGTVIITGGSVCAIVADIKVPVSVGNGFYYVHAPYIGGGLNESTATYPFSYIEGAKASITNGNESTVYPVTLTFPDPAQKGEAIVSGGIGNKAFSQTPDAAAGVYGIKDIYIDDSKRCCLWLPASSAEEKVSAITETQNCYEGTFSRPEGGTSKTLAENRMYCWNLLKSGITAGTITAVDLKRYLTPEENVVISVPQGASLSLKGTGNKLEKISFQCNGNNTIRIENLNLSSADNHTDAEGAKGYAPFYFAAGNNSLTFIQSNTLTSGQTASQAGYGSAIRVENGASLTLLAGSEFAFLNAVGNFGAGIAGGNLTIKGGNISAKDTGGTCGIHGNIVIQGGSVQAVMDSTPTNGSKTVYRNKLTVPWKKNKSISAGSIGGVSCGATIPSETGAYGIAGVSTDADGAVWFWLPDTEKEEEICLTVDGNKYAAVYQRSGQTEKRLSDTSFLKWNVLQAEINKEGEKTIDLSSLNSPMTPYIISVPESKKLTIISDGVERNNISFVLKGNNQVTIQNLNIKSSNLHANEDGVCAYGPLQVEGSACTLILRGKNTIRSGHSFLTNNYGAAINIFSDSKLIICAAEDDPTASLTAYGGYGGAGIGGGYRQNEAKQFGTGKLTIESGIIHAYGGGYGAGIGCGYNTNQTNAITINGGKVIAEGSNGASGIGKGIWLATAEDYWSKLTINGGTLSIKGGAGANYCSTMYPSINGGTIGATPVWRRPLINAAGESVSLNTLTIPGKADRAVTPIAIGGMENGTFGTKDIKTDQDGKLYFYLPASKEASAIQMTVDGTKYSSVYLREKDKAYEKTMMENLKINMPSTISYGEEWEPVVESETPDRKVLFKYSGQLENGTAYGPSDVKPEAPGKYTVEATLDNALDAAYGAEEFIITKRELKKEMISVSGNSFVYNGAPQEPVIIVKSGKKIYTKDLDYTVEYSNNSSAGTATAMVRGKGNCIGNVPVDFTISKAIPESLILPTASEITYGEELSASTLSGGSATGTWTWKNTEHIPSAGMKECEVIFTPKDTNNYDWSGISMENKIIVKVNKADSLEVLSEPFMNAKEKQSRAYTFYMNNMLLSKVDTGTKSFQAEIGNDADDILSKLRVSGNELLYLVTDTALEGQTATVKINIHTENYTDKTAVLTIHISKKDTQSIAFDVESDEMTYGDKNFAHTAALKSDGGIGAITYSSSNEKVATVNPDTGEVTIKGAGMTNIVAKKATDDNWSEATAGYGLRIDRKKVNITADDKKIIIGQPQPAYTYQKKGFIQGEDLIKEPVMTVPIADTSVIGSYPIIPDKADAGGNYQITYVRGTLTIVNGYSVTVTNGTGSGKYVEGDKVSITADNRSGYTFAQWSGDSVALEDPTAPTTTFVMPGKDVTAAAEYATHDRYLIEKKTAEQFAEGAEKKGYATVTLRKTDFVYTGYEIRPVPTVSFTYTEYGDTGERNGKVKTVKLTENVDYTLSYVNNSNAGTGSVKITGLGDYKNTLIQDFTISPKTIKNAVIEPIENVKATGEDLKTQIDSLILVKDGLLTVSQNDYQVEYRTGKDNAAELRGSISENTIVTVQINGKNNYKDSIKKTQTFTILPKDADAVSVSADFTLMLKAPEKTYIYSGKAVKPAVIVTSKAGKKIKPDRDYKISYENNINAGTGVITVSGKNMYYGSMSITFSIQPKKMSAVKVRSLSKITYRNSLKEIELCVTDGGSYLKNHVDYEIDYSNAQDLNLGKALKKQVSLSINAVPGGNFTGAKTIICHIVPRNLTNKITTKIECPDVDFTEVVAKEGAKPIPVIHYNGDELVYGKDFTVKYAANKKAGTGKIMIQGIGNYTGKKTIKFQIIKK